MAKSYSSDNRDALLDAARAAWQNIHDVYQERAMVACADGDPFTVMQHMKTAIAAETRARQITNGFIGK